MEETEKFEEKRIKLLLRSYGHSYYKTVCYYLKDTVARFKWYESTLKKFDEEYAGLLLKADQSVQVEKSCNDKDYIIEAIENAKTKLKLYRDQHTGEYIGGQEYSQLIKMLNNAQKRVISLGGDIK